MTLTMTLKTISEKYQEKFSFAIRDEENVKMIGRVKTRSLKGDNLISALKSEIEAVEWSVLRIYNDSKNEMVGSVTFDGNEVVDCSESMEALL